MVAAAEHSSATMKSPSTGTPAFANSKKRKPHRNPTNQSQKQILLSDPLLRRLSSAAAVTRSFLQTNDLYLPPSHSLRIESLLSSLPIDPPSHSSPTPASTWFHRFVNSASENDDPCWHHCFRMSKPTFFKLLSVLSSSDSTPLPSSSLAATIFRLAHNASYASLAQRFGFDSVSTASRAFFTVCKLVHEKLGQLGDPKPDYSPRLLPNCCGVLGFERFDVDGELLESLIVQAVVDSAGRFADISAGWPGTMKPEAIFRQTKLFSTAEEEFLKGAPPCKLGDGVSVPRYVLGDSRLPLLPWLVTPYSEEEEEDCSEFNDVARTALRTVGVVFAKVRSRWRILDRKWIPEMVEFLPFVVTTGCLLHNFLVDSGEDELQEEWVGVRDNTEMMKDEEYEEDRRRSEGEAYIGSSRIRDAIAENLSRVTSSSKMN